jgi:hypothetical protein
LASTNTSVAKVVIHLEGFGSPCLLFSRKKAKGTPKHGRLELLGGGTEGGDPFAALLRELEEEEKSGVLAQRAAATHPAPRLISVQGDPHYIFEITLSLDDYVEVRHAKDESLGFKAVPAAALRDQRFHSRLTDRTQRILSALGML